MEPPTQTPRQRVLRGLADGAVSSAFLLPMVLIVIQPRHDAWAVAPLVLVIAFLLPLFIHLAARPIARYDTWLQGVSLALTPALVSFLLGRITTSAYGVTWFWGRPSS